MKKIFFVSVFTLFLGMLYAFCTPHIVFADTEFTLPKASINAGSSGGSAFCFDAITGRVFYQKNATTARAMASTTKIATAITVLDNCKNLDEQVKIDKRAVGVEGTSIYLRQGEVLSVRELLYGLMLRSGNDAATALALHCAGSIEAFSELMNKMAKSAGASNTNFANPHGLDNKDHYTTAKDLAKITAYALNNDDFRQIVSTKSIKITGNEEQQYRYLTNKNRLLSSLDGCIGVKTGFTSKAGRCLVSAAEREGLRVVCVVLNCGPMFEESADIINAVFDKYKCYEVLEPYHFVTNVPLVNGEVPSIQVYSKNGLKLTLSEEEYAKINIEYDLPDSLVAPVSFDKEIGNVKVYYDKHLIFEEKIYTIDEVDSKLLKDKLKDILKNWRVLD